MNSRRISFGSTVAVGMLLLSAQQVWAQTAPSTPQDATQSSAAVPFDASPTQATSSNATDQNATVLSAIAKLDPMIGDVQILGPWAVDGRSGIWRTVMTQPLSEASGNRFFVQQIEQKDGVSSVSSSTEVTEIAEVGGAVVGYRADPPAEGQENSLTVFFDILPLDGEVSESYELFVSPNEPYRFGPASN